MSFCVRARVCIYICIYVLVCVCLCVWVWVNVLFVQANEFWCIFCADKLIKALLFLWRELDDLAKQQLWFDFDVWLKFLKTSLKVTIEQLAELVRIINSLLNQYNMTLYLVSIEKVISEWKISHLSNICEFLILIHPYRGFKVMSSHDFFSEPIFFRHQKVTYYLKVGCSITSAVCVKIWLQGPVWIG